MKKITSVLTMFFLLLSFSVQAWAQSATSLDFLTKSASMSNIEQSGTLELKLNEPFGLLELLIESEGADASSNYIDIAMLVESLFDTTISINTKTKADNNGKMYLTETHLKSNIPFKANKNLEGDIRTNYSVWTEYDFSDEENPYFNMIMSHPFAAKYITADSDLLKQNRVIESKEILQVYKAMFDSKKVAGLNDEIVECIKANATVNVNSKKVKIAFTDAGLKAYLIDTITSVLGETKKETLDENDINQTKETLSQVPLFGEKALTIDYTLDYKGRIISENAVLNVNLNLYDLMTALGEEEPPEESGITRDMCKMNFSISCNTDYKYNSVKIEKPVLTEENSIDIFEFEDPYYYEDTEYEDEYYDEEYECSWAYANIDGNCFVDGELRYVQLRSFLEDIGYAVSYDNGVISAEVDNQYVKYKNISFNIGSDVAYTESGELGMYFPLIIKDGVTYISVEDCENVTDLTRESVCYYFESENGYMEFADLEYWYGE